MKIDFEHRQSAHCENGVASNLLRFHGIEISEPMVFGVGSGLFFSFMPFLKLNGMPVSSYRTLPGQIFKRAAKRLGISIKRKTFRSQKKAMDELDQMLEAGNPVGLQTSVFYLPYLPAPFRFHFNAHNIVVYGKEKGQYLVSDPVMETTTQITPDDLVRARFAKGQLAPKGKMYFPVNVPKEMEWEEPIIKGIKNTAKDMATIPVPWFGVKAIRNLAKNVKNAPENLGKRKAELFLGNLIRMQEEIGTGGAGFRFIFAAFLQEAAEKINRPEFHQYSKQMTENGDRWRDFAFMAGKICKRRPSEGDSYQKLSEIMLDCADREIEIFQKLQKVK